MLVVYVFGLFLAFIITWTNRLVINKFYIPASNTAGHAHRFWNSQDIMLLIIMNLPAQFFFRCFLIL